MNLFSNWDENERCISYLKTVHDLSVPKKNMEVNVTLFFWWQFLILFSTFSLFPPKISNIHNKRPAAFFFNNWRWAESMINSLVRESFFNLRDENERIIPYLKTVWQSNCQLDWTDKLHVQYVASSWISLICTVKESKFYCLIGISK